MKNSLALSRDYEYAIIHWGQSNAQPNGTASSFFSEAPHLALRSRGTSFTTLTQATSSGDTLISTGVTMAENQWIGAKLFLGTPSDPEVGTARVVGNNTAGLLGVEWDVQPWAQYPNIRMLTPWLPELAGGYPDAVPSVPGYDLSVFDSSADAALFLPWTYFEGLHGYGEVDDVHGSTPATSTVVTLLGTITADLFVGGRVLVGGRTYGRVTANTATTITVESWSDGIPEAGEEVIVWRPHYEDNPNQFLKGFRYPNNEPFPCRRAANLDAALYNRPEGLTDSRTYNTEGTYLIGETLALASRLALALGVRIHVIHLATNDAGMLTRTDLISGASTVECGWWTKEFEASWSPGTPNNLAARLERLITVSAPGALLAEGNTKPIRILGIRGSQGEHEASREDGKLLYRHMLPRFYGWLRKVITDAGLSAFPLETPIPVVHSLLNVTSGGTYDTLDPDREINSAIEDFVARDPAAATFSTDDSPADSLLIHFTGVGEVLNGVAASDAMLTLINRALRQNGPGNGLEVQICNLALGFLGDTGGVTALDGTDNTSQAVLCRQFYPLAVRSLLEGHNWRFASRRASLVELTNDVTEWDYKYALPGDLLTAVAVLPANAPDDIHAMPGGGFVTGPNSATNLQRDYVIEIDEDGYQVLRTDEEDAVLRYQALVLDPSQYPPTFRRALAYELASLLAGPVIKGDAGIQTSTGLKKLAEYEALKARAADGNQRQVKPSHAAPWINSR
jgi:hypothetical protein